MRMQITDRLWDSYCVEIEAKTVKGLVEDCTVVVKPEGLMLVNVQTMSVALHTLQYHDGIADLKYDGSMWYVSQANIRPLKVRTKTSRAGIESWSNLCEEVCNQLSKEPEFSMLCMKAETARALAHIQWLHKGHLEVKSELAKIEDHLNRNMKLLHQPGIRTLEQHQLAVSLHMSGHPLPDAIEAALALTC